MYKFIPFSICSLFLLLNLQANAQTGTYSPYSRFGLGDITPTSFTRNSAMGGASIGVRDDSTLNYINFSNPASYSAFRLTVFEAGVNGSFEDFSTSTTSQNARNASLGYFALGFPIKKNLIGASFGMKPYSSTGYKISSQDSMAGVGTTLTTYRGEGGLNQFYIGSSVKLFKGFSVGANASYIFGTIDKIRSLSYLVENYYSTLILNSIDVGDLHFDLGAQYSIPFKQKYSLTLGATYLADSKLSAKETLFSRNYLHVANGGSDFTLVKDTTINETIKGKITLPGGFGGGISLRNGEKWTFAADYTFRKWSDYKSVFEVDESFTDSWRTSAGFEYSPGLAVSGKRNFFRTMIYRGGAYYSETNLTLDNINIESYGISFGVGIPLRKMKIVDSYAQSVINLSVDLGERGTTANSLIKERYARFRVGFTLNDKWFNPRKYE